MRARVATYHECVLDPFSLRVVFGAVGVCVLVLTYFVTYRGSRSSYSAWWCLALLAFGPGALLFLLNGTAAQVIANPLGNAVVVVGAVCVVAACRSLSRRSLPTWCLVVIPLLVFVPAVFDDPGRDVWPAGSVFLLTMTLLLLWACGELVRLLQVASVVGQGRVEFRASVTAMAIVSGLCAVFYGGRTITFVVVGPEHHLFQTWFGTAITCLVQIVMLVVASSSLATFSYRDQTSDLMMRVTHDPLTKVLNREGLATVIEEASRSGARSRPRGVIAADLDDFKTVNDTLGHEAGDEALLEFAQAAFGVVGADGAVARLGGDEFLIIVRGADPEEVVTAIDMRYGASGPGAKRPPVSYGIADLRPGETVMSAVSRADDALYRAKARGGGRVVRH